MLGVKYLSEEVAFERFIGIVPGVVYSEEEDTSSIWTVIRTFNSSLDRFLLGLP
jgi:hypothetical protein